MEVIALVFDCAVLTGEVKPCPFPVVRAFPLGAMFAVGALDSVETPLEKLWRFYIAHNSDAGVRRSDSIQKRVLLSFYAIHDCRDWNTT